VKATLNYEVVVVGLLSAALIATLSVIAWRRHRLKTRLLEQRKASLLGSHDYIVL
jgi:hypothetical protein